MTYKQERVLRKVLEDIFTHQAPVEYLIKKVKYEEKIWRKQDGTKK